MTPNRILRGGGTLLLLSLFFLVAGCIGAEEGPDLVVTPQNDTTADFGEQEPVSWQIDEALPIDHTVGAGVPHVRWASASADAVCPNSQAEIDLPRDADFLEITLDEPSVNTSRPGVGYATLLYRLEGEQWRDPEGETIDEPIDLRAQPPSEATRINLTQPAQGTWEIAVWPHGPVVNQAFHLHAHAQGEGPPSGDLDGLSCAG